MIETALQQLNLHQAGVGFIAGVALTLLVGGLYLRARSAQQRLEQENNQKAWDLELAHSRRQLQEATERHSALQQELDAERQRYHHAQQEARQLESTLSGARATLSSSAVNLQAVQQRYEQVNEEVKDLRAHNAQLRTRLEEQHKQREHELTLLEQAKSSLTQEFEQAAHKIFDAKQQQFTSSSRASLDQVLSPFKQQLGDFHKRVEDIYHKENSQRNQLVGQIAALQKQAQQIGDDAVNLARALKGDNKAQGSWGEVILERLLEQSGLEKGREYETQVSLQSASGRRFQPDVVVRLPDNKDIVIDAKVSLLSYEKYSSSDNEQERELALRAHIESLRNHVRALSVKEYEALEGIRTLDFVFIFVPIEAAYLLAMQHAPTLFKEAYERNVVLVSPSSLMVALRTVETIWRHEKQSKNAEKMALSAGRLYDQFVVVSKALEELGGCLNRAQEAYATTRKRLSGGRGNLLRRMEDIRKLGARTSKNLPEALRRELEEDDLSLLQEADDDAYSEEVIAATAAPKLVPTPESDRKPTKADTTVSQGD